MNRTWCFSCGDPVKGDGSRLAPLCERCRVSGRRVDPTSLRWVVRTTDGGARGPLSRDALVDQLVRKALAPEDQVARVGGRWARLCEHQDFRRYFLPGTDEASKLGAEQKADRKVKDRYVQRRRLKIGGGAVAAVGGIALAVVSSQRGLLVVPESWVDQASELFSGATDELGGRIETAVDADKALADARAERSIPGDDLVARLQAQWPTADQPAVLHITLGKAALWRGTQADAEAAREHFGRAIAAAPRDPEATSGYARAVARLAYAEPALVDDMTIAAERTAALAPESPAALLARSEVALAGGSPDLALDLVTRCGDPPDVAGMVGAAVDLDCAVATASLSHNAAAIGILDARFPNVYPILLAKASAAVASGDVDRAAAVVRPLTAQYPAESAPWRLVMAASLPHGDWGTAIEAGERIRSLDAERLPERRQLAELLLKVRGDPRGALAEYEVLLAHPLTERLPRRAALLTDAASAAVGAGDPARGLELADAALELDSGAPAAVITRSRALMALGKEKAAQATLKDVDLNRVQGNSGARYHVAAAQIFLDNGLARQAVTELRGAIDADPNWAPVHLVSAQSRLLVGNLGGAIEDIEKVAFLDKFQDRRRSPLQEVWYPAIDWRPLRKALESEIAQDARFAARGPAAVAVVAWYAQHADSGRLLDRALDAGAEVPGAYAARAQDLLARGDYRGAYRHAEQVLSGHDLTLLYALKGRSLAAMGRMAEGNAEFRKATDEPHGMAVVQRLIAETRTAEGRTDDARAAWSEVLKLVPDDLPARAALLDLRRAGQ